MKSAQATTPIIENAFFGGGCFWCLEAIFSQIKGVRSVVSGYAGGTTENPTYKQVGTGKTNHAEIVKISFNPALINYQELLNIFFSVHDPTTKNRQGNDIGTQYRSLLLYDSKEQLDLIKRTISALIKQEIYKNPIVTEILPAKKFYPAEQYHQKYFENNPAQAYCQFVISPKLAKFRKKFGEKLLKKEDSKKSKPPT